MYQNISLEQIGHIGKVHVETVNGTTFARVSVCSSNRRTDEETGEVKEFNDWLEWSFFNEKTVAFIQKYAAKGQYVRMVGKARQNSYVKGGETIYKIDVIGRRFDFLEAKEDMPDNE